MVLQLLLLKTAKKAGNATNCIAGLFCAKNQDFAIDTAETHIV